MWNDIQQAHDASELVICGCDRLRLTELSRDTPGELAQVVFGVVSYDGLVPEGDQDPGSRQAFLTDFI
jgi:hypothetical protein